MREDIRRVGFGVWLLGVIATGLLHALPASWAVALIRRLDPPHPMQPHEIAALREAWDNPEAYQRLRSQSQLIQ